MAKHRKPTRWSRRVKLDVRGKRALGTLTAAAGTGAAHETAAVRMAARQLRGT